MATLGYPITILASIPEQCNPPFLVPPRQNPWLFLPCRSGRSIMPRFMPDPDIVDREVLLPPCNIRFSLSRVAGGTHV